MMSAVRVGFCLQIVMETPPGENFQYAHSAWQRFAVPLDPIADPDTWRRIAAT